MSNIYDTLYVICAAAGILMAAFLLIFLLYRKTFLDRIVLFFCYLSAILGTFIGAHLMFFIVGLPSFSEKYAGKIYDVASFIDAFLAASSGMVFYGGLFGASLGVIIFCKARGANVRTYLNACACAFPLMHAFGRIGCTLDGCCYGMEYHGIFAIRYTAEHVRPGISDAIADFPRFPVQPMEAILEFAICFMLVKIYLKTSDRYSILAIYLFSYGIVRFFDEFLRGDTIRGLWGPFSTSQWIALGCIIATSIYFILKKQCCRASE